MIVVAKNIYGDSGRDAYYKEVGDGCFKFTPNKSEATSLTNSQVNAILEHEEYYCRLYGARKLETALANLGRYIMSIVKGNPHRRYRICRK